MGITRTLMDLLNSPPPQTNKTAATSPLVHLLTHICHSSRDFLTGPFRLAYCRCPSSVFLAAAAASAPELQWDPTPRSSMPLTTTSPPDSGYSWPTGRIPAGTTSRVGM
ncbi:hypothetical protein CDEST_09390 [Colletotrichum destructivum]|uniref:Uncharacterized protein n=1 Tax=Colletotrichum destructivum TaxID=34406 RepID=A0AAX4IMM6_9PEZI|nr:hypothetical protein CDEST_09390 [Colletotrichum destructivum]